MARSLVMRAIRLASRLQRRDFSRATSRRAAVLAALVAAGPVVATHVVHR